MLEGDAILTAAIIGVIGAILAALITNPELRKPQAVTGIFLVIFVTTGLILFIYDRLIDDSDREWEEITPTLISPAEQPTSTTAPTETSIVLSPNVEPATPTAEPSATIVPPTVTALTTLDRFEVLSTIPKNRTEINVQQGDNIRFEYLDGQWTGEKEVAPKTTGCGISFDDPFADHVWPLPPSETGTALIGYIDNQPFFIGCEPTVITAPISGYLYLGINDCRDCYWDNEGEIFVRISVE